jgi:hypothetical protein
MTPEQYYETLQDKKPFTKLTNTGISDNLPNVFEFAKMYAEAINFTGSSLELPSMEAANTEIVDSLGVLKTMKNSPCRKANYDEAYVTGFANCYNWIRDKAIT